MKLIDEWRRAYKMISVQAMALALAIQGAWPSIPADLKALLPAAAVHWVSIVLLVAGIVGRLVKQDAVSSGTEQKP